MICQFSIIDSEKFHFSARCVGRRALLFAPLDHYIEFLSLSNSQALKINLFTVVVVRSFSFQFIFSPINMPRYLFYFINFKNILFEKKNHKMLLFFLLSLTCSNYHFLSISDPLIAEKNDKIIWECYNTDCRILSSERILYHSHQRNNVSIGRCWCKQNTFDSERLINTRNCSIT